MSSKRRLVRATVAFATAAAAVTALAAPASAAQWNFVYGYVNNNATWTRFNTDRHVTTPNDHIEFDDTNLPGGGLGMYLVDASTGSRFSYVVYWYAHGPKTLADGVRSGTTFNVVARKLDANSTDNYFDGQMWY